MHVQSNGVAIRVLVQHLRMSEERNISIRYPMQYSVFQAHTLYNAAKTREPDEEKWIVHAFAVQLEYWKGTANMICSKQTDITDALQVELQTIRTEMHVGIQALINDLEQCKVETNIKFMQNFGAAVEAMSSDCSRQLIGLVEKIMSYSVKMLNDPPPCPFAAVALGSLARGEATPFSDLKYLFLIESKTAETMKYFERLAVTSYFLIGSLGETKLSYMDIDELKGWFDDRSTNGLKIDGLTTGAGNIPTGNGKTEGYQLIVTPDILMQHYKNVLANPDPTESACGDITAMLAFTQLIYSYQGGEVLLTQFTDRKKSVTLNSERLAADKEMLRSDMAKFHFEPSSGLVGRGFTINVKRELYRFPSILLYDLSIIFRKMETSSWESLKKLEQEEILTSAAHNSLKFLLACACFIRLAKYLHHGSHDDRVSVASQMNSFHVFPGMGTVQQQRWFVPNKMFPSMCEQLIPLKVRPHGVNFSRIWKNS